MTTKKMSYSVLSLAIILLFTMFSPRIYADSGDSLAVKRIFTESEIADYVNTFKNEIAEEYHIPYMGMAIVYNDSAIYMDTAGYADVENHIKTDPHLSRFSVGSTGKIMAYLSIMQLAEAGKIDLEKDIYTYLDFKIDLQYDDPIRIIDLMNHRGGFEDTGYNLKADSYETVIPLKKWLMENTPKQVYKPDTYTAYSNYGICLLGQIVATVSGKSYEEYVHENIFDRLGMQNSTINQNITEHLVKCYQYKKADSTFALQDYEYWNTKPAGSMRSTPEDMAKLLTAMLNGGACKGNRILSQETMDLMHENSWSIGDGMNGLAHGLMEMHYNGYKYYGHGGTTSYQHTSFYWFPELGLGFYITGGCAEAPKANKKFVEDFIDSSYVKKTTDFQFIDGIDLKKYTGVFYPARINYSTYQKAYRLLNNVKIETDGEWLLVKPDHKLKPVNARLFVAEDGNAKVLFDIDQNGKITGFSSSPISYYFKQSPLEQNLFMFTLPGIGLIILGAIGLARFIIFIIRKIKKRKADLIVKKTKIFSSIFIGYIWLTMVIFMAFFIMTDTVKLMQGHLLLLRIACFLLLLTVPMALFQIYKTIRFFNNAEGHGLLKTAELFICLASMGMIYWLFYWNLVGIPYLF